MIARRDAHIALHAPHRRSSSGLALSIHIMALHPATHRHPKARPHHAALGLLPEVAMCAAVRCGNDVHVIARRRRRALRGHHIAAGDVHIIARTHRHGVARESAAHVPAVPAGIIRLDRRGREQATRAVLVFISCTAGFVGRLDAHITPGRCTERALGHNLRAFGHHVLTGAYADVVAADLRAHIFAAGERGAVHAAFADAVRTVGLVHQIRAGQRADPVGGTAVIGPADLLPEVLVDRPQAEVAACGQIHVARSGDHGCIGRDVTACGQGDVLAADTGNLVDVGAAGHRIGGAHAGAVDVDVASGFQPA